MNKHEKLMQSVRDAEKGTYAKGKAWVIYMKDAKVPATEPRRIVAYSQI